MFQINIGDFGTRFKRGLGIKGRVPVGCDETAVPVIIAENLTDPLFAQNPATFSCILVVGPGDTINVKFGALWNGINPNVTAIVDHIVAMDVSTSAPVSPLLFWLGRNVPNPGGGSQQIQTAILNQDGPGTARAILQQCQATNGSNAGNPFALWSQIGEYAAPQNGIFQMDLGAVLYPGDAFGVSNGPEAATVTRVVQLFGREYTAQ